LAEAPIHPKLIRGNPATAWIASARAGKGLVTLTSASNLTKATAHCETRARAKRLAILNLRSTQQGRTRHANEYSGIASYQAVDRRV
jgi:hypothetical protein